MIRVLHFVHRMPPEYSGAGRQALTLVDALRSGNDAVDEADRIDSNLLTYSRAPAEVERPDGIPTSVVRLRSGPLGKLRQYFALRRAIRAARADVLHVHGYHRPALVFGRSSRCKIVLKTTMLGTDDLVSIRGKGWLDRRVVRAVDRIIALTPAMAAANSGATHALTIPNGVDLARFAPGAAPQDPRASAGIGADELLLLYTGGDSERKGFALLPDLWTRLRERLAPRKPRLVACGRFTDPANAIGLQRALGPDASVRDELLDMPAWLNACDLFLFLSEQEGLPNSVLEAVASDTFCLSRDLPGTLDGVLTPENSITTDSFDDAALTALENALERGAHRAVDNAGFRERFGLDAIAARYRRLYVELAQEARR